MVILVDHPQAYYHIFYLLTFVCMFSVVIYKSIKRGYHLSSVLLMLTTITLFIIVGTRMATIPIESWLDVIGNDSHQFNGRSSIGGVLFGLLGLLVSQQLFGTKGAILDVFAWLAPISLAISKIGCFVNGCCFGLPFDGFWGVEYPVKTNAHYNHWTSGVIESDALQSIAVHPVQLYESFILVLVGLIVYNTQKRWKMKGSSLLFAMFLYFTLRFGVEFFRDHSVSNFTTIHYLGVWSIQWSMLFLGLVLGCSLWLNEKKSSQNPIKLEPKSPSVHSKFIFIILLSSVIYMFRYLLEFFELMAVWLIFIPAVVLVLYSHLTENRSKNHRRMFAALCVLPLFVLAQNVSEESLEIATDSISDETSKILKYHRIDFGGSFGRFANEIKFNQTTTECGGTNFDTDYFKQVYQLGGAGYSRVIIKNNHMTTYGANVSGGTIKSTSQNTNQSETDFLYSVNPYFKWDSKWFGGGLGFYAGNLRLNNETSFSSENLDDANKSYNFLPEFHVRVGPRNYVDVDYNYGFLMPSAVPAIFSRSSIGSSFGLGHDYSFRFGQIWNLDTPYISVEALLTNNWGFNLMYVFKEEDYDFQNELASGKFIFSINYRFGHQKK